MDIEDKPMLGGKPEQAQIQPAELGGGTALEAPGAGGQIVSHMG
jgi:hypothetical protein